MNTFLFYFFASLTLLSAFMVVLNRNTVNSALCMIISFVSVSGLFVLLQGYFLGILQVLVYAGAVMVLFLFVIMLLDVETLSQYIPSRKHCIFSVCLFLVLTALGMYCITPSPDLPSPPLTTLTAMPADIQAPFSFCTSAKAYGYALFTKYMLPIQVAGFLLLTAMIGVIVISKPYTQEK